MSADTINEERIQTIEISSKPLVVVFDKALKDYFCDDVIKYADHLGFDKSKVIDANNVIQDDVRTGSHTFDYEQQLNFILPFFSTITGYPQENFEGIQILKYKQGEEYGDHFDFFNTDDNDVANERVATVMLYLNDDFSGGETNFPELNKEIKPQKGSILYFCYNYDEDLNNKTLHSGLPVEEGTKYVLVTWIRANKYEEDGDKEIRYAE